MAGAGLKRNDGFRAAASADQTLALHKMVWRRIVDFADDPRPNPQFEQNPTSTSWVIITEHF
jgi:hypothetical protein